MANEFQSLIGEEAFESVDVDVISDSESWQVVDHSDSDDGDVITTDDDVSIATTDDEESEGVPDVDDLIQRQFGSAVSDISVKSLVDEISPIHSQEVKSVYQIDRNRQMIGNYVAAVKGGGLIDGVDDPYQITQEVKNVGYEIDNSRRMIDECYNEEESEDLDEEEEEDDDEDSDLDDELVPKWLSNKFERQRMRKLGKKSVSEDEEIEKDGESVQQARLCSWKTRVGIEA